MTANTKITVFAILLVLGALAAGVFAGWNRPIAPADVNFTSLGITIWPLLESFTVSMMDMPR